jgi:predicted transcriptional regulator
MPRRNRKPKAVGPAPLKWALYLNGIYIKPDMRFTTKRAAVEEQAKAHARGLQAVVLKI